MASSRTSLWQHAGFWRLASLAASVVAIVLALMLAERPAAPPVAPAKTVAFLGEQKPSWKVDLDLAHRRIKVEPLADVELTDSDYELWLVPAGHDAPRSLGILQTQGETIVNLPEDLAKLAETATGFIVSIEPPGGSPAGQPSGQIVGQGTIVKLD